MNLKPLTGASNKSSTKNICVICGLARNSLSTALAALELETNVNEIVRRPRTRVLERQLPFVLRSDLFHFLVKLRFTIAFDQKRRVHDHAVADRFIRTRRNRGVAQL